MSWKRQDLIRAAIADMHGRLDYDKWETSAAAFMKSVWFTDCKSCYDTLQKPIAKTIDKRLGIELAALRQSLWRNAGTQKPEFRTLEEKPKEPTDTIRWIDTTVMVGDCLTKQMKDTYLNDVITNNWWDFTQTEEAKAIKARKQAQRSKASKEGACDMHFEDE